MAGLLADRRGVLERGLQDKWDFLVSDLVGYSECILHLGVDEHGEVVQFNPEGNKQHWVHNGRLTEEQVLALRQDRLLGMSIGELATRYDISVKQAWNIVTRRAWAHLDRGAEPVDDEPMRCRLAIGHGSSSVAEDDDL
jgi:predicted DNA-binding protein (UPF0251 family)